MKEELKRWTEIKKNLNNGEGIYGTRPSIDYTPYLLSVIDMAELMKKIKYVNDAYRNKLIENVQNQSLQIDISKTKIDFSDSKNQFLLMGVDLDKSISTDIENFKKKKGLLLLNKEDIHKLLQKHIEKPYLELKSIKEDLILILEEHNKGIISKLDQLISTMYMINSNTKSFKRLIDTIKIWLQVMYKLSIKMYTSLPNQDQQIKVLSDFENSLNRLRYEGVLILSEIKLIEILIDKFNISPPSYSRRDCAFKKSIKALLEEPPPRGCHKKNRDWIVAEFNKVSDEKPQFNQSNKIQEVMSRYKEKFNLNISRSTVRNVVIKN